MFPQSRMRRSDSASKSSNLEHDRQSCQLDTALTRKRMPTKPRRANMRSRPSSYIPVYTGCTRRKIEDPILVEDNSAPCICISYSA